MIFLKKALFHLTILLCASPLLAQTTDISLKTNPLLELGINTNNLALKGNIKEMQEHQFVTNEQGHTTNDSASISYIYKFDQNGMAKEIEETIRNLQTKKSFYSYTNRGFISHIDIETTRLLTENDSTQIDSVSNDLPDFSTMDYKYVQKKNILFKSEDYIINTPKKNTTRTEYFYHFNDENQISQIDYQTSDLTTKFNYDANGVLKETLTLKSGVPFYKNIYKYDRNNRLINIAKINSDNTSKFPSEETVISYKIDSNGNITEKKIKTFLYSSKAPKKFVQGNLYLYQYTYL
ncbi:hypothetical protein [Flavobacterium sp.]|uniref:hypothetical protein n=1 Tax=Flavobacterium sp. TaxID=239 RepID=UPI002C3EEC07|nr:hypothetical protein [Flavobacterium sp.]HSD08366.1 hypothetical protein [Flavobacterium sp.]